MSSTSQSTLFGGIATAFSDRNFRFYSIGAIATWIGFFVQLVAVSWYAWELTESTKWLAIVALLDIVPNVVLAPLAGAIADRYDKYRLMGLVSFLALIQATVIALLAWHDLLTIWPFAILVLIHGIIISFMVPAMYGILPRFVERSCLTSAIAVSSSYSQLAVFLGPAIAGWIIASYGVAVAFAVNAAGYLIYLFSWVYLKTPDSFKFPKPSTAPILADIKAGAKYILNHRVISSLLVILLFGDALGASIFYMTPAYSEQFLGLGVMGVSIVLAAKGIGATLAAFWIARGGEKMATFNRMQFGYLCFLLSALLIFLSPNMYLAVLAFVFLGFAAESYHTVMLSMVQLTVKEEQRGRVMSTLFMLSQLASGIGTYLVGYLAVQFGLTGPIMVVTAICFIVWIRYYLKRKSLASTYSQSLN